MKKILLFAITALAGISGMAQTTAPNFNANDCDGTNHDLYSELNAGKVVVIVFVMPCTACIGPALSAYNEVQNWSSSNPGRVVMYISDDLGTTSCTTLTNWIATNGMTGTPGISNTALKEADYGSGGMPKTVVIAGDTHEVIFTQNGSLNATNFNAAINQALIAGIMENSKADFKLSLFPNPSATSQASISYTLKESADITVEIYNSVGSKAKVFNFENQPAGNQQSILNFETLTNGVYFMKLNAGSGSQVLKFTVSH
jgi:hypothetical protein